MNVQETLATLNKLGKPQTAAIYRRHGAGDNVFGVLTSEIAKLQKKIKADHALAMELWKTGNAEARVATRKASLTCETRPATVRVRRRDAHPAGWSGVSRFRDESPSHTDGDDSTNVATIARC